MRTYNRLSAIVAATLLVLTALAPAALALEATAGNAAGNLAVETHEATNVTNSSARLKGEVTSLGDAENATVYFEYWPAGDRANATTTATATLEDPNEFAADVDGLRNDTTYVYVAYAEADGTTVAGEEVTFTTGGQADDGGDGPFGQSVSSFVHKLLEKRGDLDRPFGQVVSEFVTKHNPGQGPPEHAGPPEDEGPDDAGKPDDVGPSGNQGPDGKETGRPDDAGPAQNGGPEDADDDGDDDQDDGDDDEGSGPPAEAGAKR